MASKACWLHALQVLRFPSIPPRGMEWTIQKWTIQKHLLMKIVLFLFMLGSKVLQVCRKIGVKDWRKSRWDPSRQTGIMYCNTLKSNSTYNQFLCNLQVSLLTGFLLLCFLTNLHSDLCPGQWASAHSWEQYCGSSEHSNWHICLEIVHIVFSFKLL